MKRIGLFVFSVVLAIGLLAGAPGVAKAIPTTTVDFNDGSNPPPVAGEGINYNGIGGNLFGTNLPVEYTHIEYLGAPLTTITNGILNFNTGALVSSGIIGGATQYWIFAPNYSPAALQITGTVGTYTGVLYQAEMLGSTVVTTGILPNQDGSMTLTETGQTLGGPGSFINPAVLTALGLSPTSVLSATYPGDYTVTFAAYTNLVGNSISWDNLSGGHVQAPLAAVPVPPSLLLFAPALLGLIGIRKRFKG